MRPLVAGGAAECEGCERVRGEGWRMRGEGWGVKV